MNLDWCLIEKKYSKTWHKFTEYIVGLVGDCDYCSLEKFFDSNRIIIGINYSPMLKHYEYTIWYSKNNKGFYADGAYNSRSETKIAAIYKSFDILEEKLNV